MRLKIIVPLGILWLLFSAISTIAMQQYGYVELWKLPFQNSGTLQLYSDLVVASLLIMVWMYQDSRKTGVPLWPYILITIAVGSFGPIYYLLHREWRLNKQKATEIA